MLLSWMVSLLGTMWPSELVPSQKSLASAFTAEYSGWLVEFLKGTTHQGRFLEGAAQ